MNRIAPSSPPSIALTEILASVLNRLIPDRTDEQGANKQRQSGSLASYLIKIGRLGGYLARAKDPLQGDMVMSRGMSRLNGIELGVLFGAGLVGN